jgi:hypothetical protein
MENVNEKFMEYKKNRKWLVKIPLNLKDLKTDFKSKIAIVVPYRDNPDQNRSKQLKKFIDYYHNYLPNIQILIVEQSENKKFNRGALLNIGFEYMKKEIIDQFIFHDVDLISPKELKPLYSYKSDNPIHLASLWTEKYKFSTFLGGIISFDKQSFEAINGFPNNFFGWGGEDDALYNRLAKMDISVLAPFSEKRIEIKEIYHMKTDSKKEYTNLQKKENVLEDIKFWKKNGLNSLCYEILKEENVKYKNVLKIKVDI